MPKSNHDLISAVFSSAAKASASQSVKTAKKKKEKKEASSSVPSIVVPNTANPNGATTPKPTTAATPTVPVDDGWTTVAKRQKPGVAKKKLPPYGHASKKNTTKVKKGKLQGQHASSACKPAPASSKGALSKNSFFVPNNLQKHLHEPSSHPTKKSKTASATVAAASSATKKSAGGISFLAIMMAQSSQPKKKNKVHKKKLPPLKKAPKVAPIKPTVVSSKATSHVPVSAVPAVASETCTLESSSPSVADEQFLDCLSKTSDMVMDEQFQDCLSEESISVHKSSREQSRLLSLPYDLMVGNILSFLRHDEIASFARCNRVARRIGQEGYLWQTMFRQRFPQSKLSPATMQEWKLAYQLRLSNIVDHTRCFYTKKTFFEDVLGVGINYTVNPVTKRVDYVDVTYDLLSEKAFREHKVRKDAYGNTFKLFLPLYFSEDHFQRALPQIQYTIRRLCPHRKVTWFEPTMVLDVFPKIITTFSVLLSDEGIAASRKSFNGLTRIHRLFMALAHEYPTIKREALMRLKLFATQEKLRIKSACPSLGDILPLFLIVDQHDFSWRNIMPVYLQEVFDRGVLWVCKECPSLERTDNEESEAEVERRVEVTREAMTVTLRLLMFQVFFIRSCCQGTTQQRSSRYDRFFGQLDPELEQQPATSESVGQESGNDGDADTVSTLSGGNSNPDADAASPTKPDAMTFASFRDQVNSILSVSTWHEIFRFVGARCPKTKADMAALLRRSVVNSRQKRYHKAGMDFSRVQKSGTSKILSKGQKYSASSSLKRVTFLDVWSFRDRGRYRFLDATCILYKGRKRVKTIDYQNLTDERRAIVHSGDQMRQDGGTHTIQIDLERLGSDITACVFVISAWNDSTLEDILSPSVSFVDADAEPGAPPLCTYDLDSHDKIPHLTSVIMCKLYRARRDGESSWHVQAIGDAHQGAADNYGPIYNAVDKLMMRG